MKRADWLESTVAWGACEECETSVFVARHLDAATDLPDMDEWENGGIFSRCYVCGEDVEWCGTDPVKAVFR